MDKQSHRLFYRGVSLTAIIGIVLAIQLCCVLGYEEIITFDINSTYSLDNCSRIMWYPDIFEGNSSPPALRSGPIKNSGKSCVEKIVEGPAYINFMWKIDHVNGRIGELSFNVDNKTILVCASSSWSPASYAISSGNHTLSWEYRKQYSYPEFEGAGWIDDLRISSLEGQIIKEIPIDLPSNTSFLDSKENLDKFETKIYNIETDLFKLHEAFGILSNRNTSEPTSWINENVVFISNSSLNLSKIIYENKNKIIILGDGVYNTSGLKIDFDGVHLRSFRKWGARIDGGNATECILLDSVKNVTLDSLAISNSTNGIHVENSSNCNINNNCITEFDDIGIVVKNSSQCLFTLNYLDPYSNHNRTGIQLIDSSNNNTFLFNKIHLDKDDDRSWLYNVISSKDNVIYISDDGYIREGPVFCGIKDSKKFICNWTNNNTTVDFEPLSKNMWAFLD